MKEVDWFVHFEKPDDMFDNKNKEFEQSDQNNKGYCKLYLLSHFPLGLSTIACYKSPY